MNAIFLQFLTSSAQTSGLSKGNEEGEGKGVSCLLLRRWHPCQVLRIGRHMIKCSGSAGTYAVAQDKRKKRGADDDEESAMKEPAVGEEGRMIMEV
eukprot:scaffold36145_cov17-Tisochrysis_lutea.AAC.1